MFKSIAEQSGNYSYSINITPKNYSFFEFGFSGDANPVFRFSGLSGKFYDGDANYVYSYLTGQSFVVSGNKFKNYNNYFINNVYINDENSNSNENTEAFYSSDNISTNLSFNGNPPDFGIGSGVFFNGSQTGLIDVNNLGQTKFKVFSGQFIGASGEIFSVIPPFDSGNVITNKFLNIASNFIGGHNEIYSVPIRLFTNFGIVEQNVSVKSVFDIIRNFFISGPSLIQETGNYNYNFDYNLFFGNQPSSEDFFGRLGLASLSGYSLELSEFESISPRNRISNPRPDFVSYTGINGEVSEYIDNILVVEGAGQPNATGFYYLASGLIGILSYQGSVYYTENGTSSFNQKRVHYSPLNGGIFEILSGSQRWYYSDSNKSNFTKRDALILEENKWNTGIISDEMTNLFYSGQNPTPTVRRAKWSDLGLGIQDTEITYSGFLRNSGILTGSYAVNVTGYNNFLNTASEGVSFGNLLSTNKFATGNFSVPYATSATGIVTGTTFTNVGQMSGGYNFQENKEFIFTGQASAISSHVTGINFTGTFDSQPFERKRTVTLFSEPIEASANVDTTVNYDWAATSSGFGSGLITNTTDYPLNQSGFQETFLIGFTGYLDAGQHIVTGQKLETVTGLTGISQYGFSFGLPFQWVVENGSYTNFATGIVDVSGETIVTGQDFATGILTFTANYPSTGFTGYDFEYNYLSICSSPNFVTGNFVENVFVESSSPFFTQPRTFLTGSYPVSGLFSHSFSSAVFPNFLYSLSQIEETTSTGETFFQGNYQSLAKETGVFLGNCYGEGYTGKGIGGFAEIYKTFVDSGERFAFPNMSHVFSGNHSEQFNSTAFVLDSYRKLIGRNPTTFELTGGTFIVNDSIQSQIDFIKNLFETTQYKEFTERVMYSYKTMTSEWPNIEEIEEMRNILNISNQNSTVLISNNLNLINNYLSPKYEAIFGSTGAIIGDFVDQIYKNKHSGLAPSAQAAIRIADTITGGNQASLGRTITGYNGNRASFLRVFPMDNERIVFNGNNMFDPDGNPLSDLMQYGMRTEPRNIIKSATLISCLLHERPVDSGINFYNKGNIDQTISGIITDSKYSIQKNLGRERFDRPFSGNYIPLTGFYDSVEKAFTITGSSTGIALIPLFNSNILETGDFVYNSRQFIDTSSYKKSPLFLKTYFAGYNYQFNLNQKSPLSISANLYYFSGDSLNIYDKLNYQMVFYTGDIATGKISADTNIINSSSATKGDFTNYRSPSSIIGGAEEGFNYVSISTHNDTPEEVIKSGFYVIGWSPTIPSLADSTVDTIYDNVNYKQLPENSSFITQNNPNPKAILSFRKANPIYTGNCIRIKRQDSETKDISFFENFINISEIDNFCQNSTGFLDIWYDQSENDFHIYATGSNLPIIWDGENFKTGAIFQNNSLLRSSKNFGLQNSDNLSTIISANLYTQRQYSTIWSQAGPNSFNRRFAISVPEAYSGVATDVWAPRGSVVSGHKINLNEDYTFGVYHRSYPETITGGAHFWVNGEKYGSSGYGGSATVDLEDGALWVGGFTNLGNGYWDGRIQEIIIYDSDITGEFERLTKESRYYWNNINNKFSGYILTDFNRWPTGLVKSGIFTNKSEVLNTGYNTISTGSIISGTGRVENHPYEPLSSFYFEQNFTGLSPTGHYFKSTGSYSTEISTGIFEGGFPRARLFAQTSNVRLESGIIPSSSFRRIKEYRIQDYNNTQEIFLAVQKDLPHHSVFLSGDKIVIEENKGYQGIRIGWGSGFVSAPDPNSVNFEINNFANNISGNEFFGSGFLSANNFESTTTGVTGTIDLTGLTGENISRNDIIGKISYSPNVIFGQGNNINLMIESTFTGKVPSTGLFESNLTTTILSGQTFSQTSFPFGPTNFSGNPDTINSRLMQLGLNVSGYQPILNENWSGFLNKQVFWTGIKNESALFSGIRFLPPSFLDFTGTHTGVGILTGIENITINNGSGIYQFNKQVTGLPDSTSAIINRIGTVVSGAVAITPFIGFLNNTFTGTGFYFEKANQSFINSGLEFLAPTYQKTFTGEYELYSGIDTGNLVKINNFIGSNIPMNNEIFTGVNPYPSTGDQYIVDDAFTGAGNILFQIRKKKRFEESPDTLLLYFTGDNNFEFVKING